MLPKRKTMNNFNFISLHVKCPVCNKSFMDHEQKVDNEPSIKLNIKTPEKTGIIRLSSIYGSYNYTCNISIGADVIAVFYCPHCNSEITSETLCNACNGPMSTVILDIGGKINFCSRKGCKNHNIGFEDLSEALTKLYEEFGYRGNQSQFNGQYSKGKRGNKEENKEILETGTYIQGYCPHCKKSLIEHDMFKLKVERKDGESGLVMLSPYLNIFSTKSNIFLPEDQTASDIKCFHCDKSLIVEGGKCEKCGTQIAKILVPARTKMSNFYICSKKGCTWHGLSKEDIDDIRLEDSMEW